LAFASSSVIYSKRSDFGMKTGIPSVGDEIALTIGFEGAKD
jgi:polyisoprenoid-binding protein YceI